LSAAHKLQTAQSWPARHGVACVGRCAIHRGPPAAARHMITVYKAILGPVLLVQGRRARRKALRLPEPAGPRSGVVGGAGAGAPALRVLFVGDSSAAGVGVDHQDEALAPQTAAFLCRHIGAPVQWQLLAKSGINTHEALALLAANELKPADLLVSSLGVNDVTSQRSPQQFLADYRLLIERTVRATGARAAIINGLPPMHAFPAMPQPLRWYLGACAARLDALLQRWVERDNALAYVSLQWGGAGEMARDGFHPGAAQYRHWARLVAQRALTLLNAHDTCDVANCKQD
jgi:lysophospholipase L1-like esterase